LDVSFGFRSCNKDLTLIQVYRPCHLTNPSNWTLLSGMAAPRGVTTYSPSAL